MPIGCEHAFSKYLHPICPVREQEVAIPDPVPARPGQDLRGTAPVEVGHHLVIGHTDDLRTVGVRGEEPRPPSAIGLSPPVQEQEAGVVRIELEMVEPALALLHCLVRTIPYDLVQGDDQPIRAGRQIYPVDAIFRGMGISLPRIREPHVSVSRPGPMDPGEVEAHRGSAVPAQRVDGER